MGSVSLDASPHSMSPVFEPLLIPIACQSSAPAPEGTLASNVLRSLLQRSRVFPLFGPLLCGPLAIVI